MIPFSYRSGEMMDYYAFNFNSKPDNNRKITLDTKDFSKVWMPYTGDKNGLKEYFDNLHSGRYIEVDEVIWKPNYEFEDTLKYSHCSRGRSSWKLHFVSTMSDHKYEMFSTDFDDLMKAKGFNKDVVSGRFTFVKRGSNYGIKLVE